MTNAKIRNILLGKELLKKCSTGFGMVSRFNLEQRLSRLRQLNFSQVTVNDLVNLCYSKEIPQERLNELSGYITSAIPQLPQIRTRETREQRKLRPFSCSIEVIDCSTEKSVHRLAEVALMTITQAKFFPLSFHILTVDANACSNNNAQLFFVSINAEGELCGVAQCIRDNTIPHITINYLATRSMKVDYTIDPKFQGTGTRLLDAVVEYAEQHHYSYIELLDAANLPFFYSNYGFITSLENPIIKYYGIGPNPYKDVTETTFDDSHPHKLWWTYPALKKVTYKHPTLLGNYFPELETLFFYGDTLEGDPYDGKVFTKLRGLQLFSYKGILDGKMFPALKTLRVNANVFPTFKNSFEKVTSLSMPDKKDLRWWIKMLKRFPSLKKLDTEVPEGLLPYLVQLNIQS